MYIMNYRIVLRSRYLRKVYAIIPKKVLGWKDKLFNTQKGEIYVGLLDRVIQFCKDHGYNYSFTDSEFYGLPFEVNEFISKRC